MYVKLYTTSQAFARLRKEYSELYNKMYPPMQSGPALVNAMLVGLREAVTAGQSKWNIVIDDKFWHPSNPVFIRYYKDLKEMQFHGILQDQGIVILSDVGQLNYKCYLIDEVWVGNMETRLKGYVKEDEFHVVDVENTCAVD